MKITITRTNNFEVLMEHDFMKANGRDADLLTAFNLVAPRFAEATRQKIDPIEPHKKYIETWLNELEADGKVVIEGGMPPRYGTSEMSSWA